MKAGGEEDSRDDDDGKRDGDDGKMCSSHAALTEAAYLLSKMMQCTHAPVHYFQNDIIHVNNLIQQSLPSLHTCASQIISDGLAPQTIPPPQLFNIITSEASFPTIPASVLEGLASWSFDEFLYEDMELLSMLKYMFEHFKLTEVFNIKQKTLELFLVNVKEHYFANAYHNFRHAFDVTQTAFCYLVEKNIQRYLEPIDILVFLLTCVCHDIEHGGLNNSYLAYTGAEIALLHNDVSILENHHAYVTFKLLQRPELNILANIEPTVQKQIRKRVIDCILHTDMALHGSYHMPLLKSYSSTSSFGPDENSRVLLVDLLAHLCDLSNVAKPFRLSFIWCDKVTVEFFNQGRLEKLLGCPLKPNLDYENTTVAKNMVAFIDFLADYFNVFAKVLPELADYLNNAFNNRQEWEKIILSQTQSQTQIQKDAKPP